MKEPAIGERCLVHPQANIRVQEHASIPGRIMPAAWTERVWDDWLHLRFRSGEILVKPLEEPEWHEAPAEAGPEKTPIEMVDGHGELHVDGGEPAAPLLTESHPAQDKE